MIERRAGTAFIVAGTLLLASLLAPPVLAALTSLAWITGLGLLSLAVVAIVVGLVGTARRTNSTHPITRLIAVVATITSGVIAGGLLVALIIVGIGITTADLAVPRPMGLFRMTVLGLATALGLGYLSIGIEQLRASVRFSGVGPHMLLAGVALLVPVGLVAVGPLLGIRLPAWVVFGVLVVVALDTILIGRRL